MDQMLAWTLVHREYTRRYGARPRCDDAFYGSDVHASTPRRSLVGHLWRTLRRGR